MNATDMVSEEQYVQLCDDLEALMKAWEDRLDIPLGRSAAILLQIGGSIFAWNDLPLEHALDFVRHAWATANEDRPHEEK